MKKPTTLPLLMLIALLSFASCQSKTTCERRFSHHVFFWLNDPDNPEDRAAFERGVNELLTIPEIKSHHFGVPADVGERDVVDGTYTYSYLVFFEDLAGHDAYQVHPKHLEFIEEYGYLWDRVVVYDSVME
jgi:hypothetical protein